MKKHIIFKQTNANELTIIIAKNAVENNDTAKCMLLKNRYKHTMQNLKKLDIQLWLNVRAISNSNSVNWGTNTAGHCMLVHCKLNEKDLQNKAKRLLSNIMQKVKNTKFNAEQMKNCVDCCTKEELLKCCNNSHYNTDKLLQLVGKKASKYNR